MRPRLKLEDLAGSAALFLIMISAVHADIPVHAPVPEYECAASCWTLNTEDGRADFSQDVRAYGPDPEALMWSLQGEQCPSPGVVVHPHLHGEQVNVNTSLSQSESSRSSHEHSWYVNYGPFFVNEGARDAYSRSDQSSSSYTRTRDSTIQLEFDSATPQNSCFETRRMLPPREIGGRRVGG